MNKLSSQRERQRALFLYYNALERGDFDTLSKILKLAEQDAVLERMIAALDAAMESEDNHPQIDSNVTIRYSKNFSPNGQTPSTDHSEEDTSMYSNSLENYSGLPSPKSTRSNPQWLTLLAAVLALVLMSSLMIIMERPIIGNPLVLQVVTPTPIPLEKITPENVDRLTQLYEIQRNSTDNTFLAFSPDGKTFAYGDSTTTVKLWDIENQQEKKELPSVETQSTDRLVYSPDGTKLAGSGPNNAVIWDVTGSEKPLVLPYESDVLGTGPLAFSADGKTLINVTCSHFGLGCDRQDVYVWDSNTGDRVSFRRYAASNTGDNALSPTQGLWFVGFNTGLFLSRDIAEGTDQTVYQYQGAGIVNLGISNDGTLLASANVNRRITIWDVQRGKGLGLIVAPDQNFDFNWMIFSPDDSMLASISAPGDNTVQFWDISKRKRLSRIEILPQSQDAYLWGIAFSPDGKLFATNSNDGKVRIWGVIGNG